MIKRGNASDSRHNRDRTRFFDLGVPRGYGAGARQAVSDRREVVSERADSPRAVSGSGSRGPSATSFSFGGGFEPGEYPPQDHQARSGRLMMRPIVQVSPPLNADVFPAHPVARSGSPRRACAARSQLMQVNAPVMFGEYPNEFFLGRVDSSSRQAKENLLLRTRQISQRNFIRPRVGVAHCTNNGNRQLGLVRDRTQGNSDFILSN